jgi:5-methylcytosine-specific restriction endonuclease McrA
VPAAWWSPERVLGRALLAKATEVLSGPDGLAALLRQGLETHPYTTVSLPLDVGEGGEIIPAHLRRAIIVRDQHCRFPGCFQPPAVCQVHHLIHREDGGPTSLANCALVCRFHHLIVIHRWRWRLTLNPDGTTTATSPDSRILHSHSPPGQAA